MTQRQRVITFETVEEIGKAKQLGMEIEILWEVSATVPRTYDYPGDKAYAEAISVKVTAAWSESWMAMPGQFPRRDQANHQLTRWNAPEWLDGLEDTACELLEKHYDTFAEHALDEAADRHAADQQLHAELWTERILWEEY